METIPIFLQIPPENIVNLKFTVESYEGLGIVRTLDANAAVVVILALSDTFKDVTALVDELAAELHITRIERPACVDGDWLLSESEK